MDRNHSSRSKSKPHLSRVKNQPDVTTGHTANHEHLHSENEDNQFQFNIENLSRHISNLSRNRQLVAEDLRDGWDMILKEIRSTYRKVTEHL